MGQLERRAKAISGEFNSQNVANTLWSLCFFCMISLDLDCVFLSFLVAVASRLDFQFFCGLDRQRLCQVHQFFIACDIEESLGMRLPASINALKADLGPACKAAFLVAPANPSASQQQVSHTLRDMSLSVEDEVRYAQSQSTPSTSTCRWSRLAKKFLALFGMQDAYWSDLDQTAAS